MSGSENTGAPSRPARIGYEGLLRVLLRYRDEPSRGEAHQSEGHRGGGHHGEARRSNELDRLHLLRRAGRELGLSERGLLLRGFDKAYRRMVEGL